MTKISKTQMQPYIIIAGMFIIFLIFALITQAPAEIFTGIRSIVTSRGVLITDYMEIGGIGAALLNAVIIGTITIIFFIRLKITPTGSTVMSILLTVGFSLFGKNILTMLPITFGVWLYSKSVKKPFSDFYIIALLAATISPIVSEIIFLDILYTPANFIMGILLGTLAGFLFPMISEFTFKIHGGYQLYNMGFAGGLLATFFIAFLTSIDIKVIPAEYISSGNNLILGILLYIISIYLVLCGIILGDKKKIISDLLAVMKCSGKHPSDFYSQYGANIYVNMGLLCALGTSLMLVLGAELNGAAIAGILTITGFGAFGKHLKNVTPLFIGAIIATQINKWNPTDNSNVLAILFCTGLAPIAGQYGVMWGVFAGFIHVCVAHHIGYLSSGLNLYSNGFTAGFVTLMIIPIIESATKFSRRYK